MTESTVATTCKRGHERNAENTREHTITERGKERVVRTCLRCLEIAKAARKNAATQGEPTA